MREGSARTLTRRWIMKRTSRLGSSRWSCPAMSSISALRSTVCRCMVARLAWARISRSSMSMDICLLAAAIRSA
jgi:hypothetical protein